MTAPSNPQPREYGAVERTYLDYEYYVWTQSTDPGIQAMTRVALDIELKSRIKGEPHDPSAVFIRSAGGYYAKLRDGVVWMATKRRIPVHAFDYL